MAFFDLEVREKARWIALIFFNEEKKKNQNLKIVFDDGDMGPSHTTNKVQTNEPNKAIFSLL